MLPTCSSLTRARLSSIVLHQPYQQFHTRTALRIAADYAGSPANGKLEHLASAASKLAAITPPAKRPRGRPRKIPSVDTLTEPKAPKAEKGSKKDSSSDEPVEKKISAPKTKETRSRSRKLPSNKTLYEPKSLEPAEADLQEENVSGIEAPVFQQDADADLEDPAIDAKSPKENRATRKFVYKVYKGKICPDNPLRPQDKSRIHVTSDSLCDDVVTRLKPSLEKHIGCDIIDMNPGPGLFSSKLHEFLKPRTHILLEPDPVYEPALDPLLEAEGSTYKLVQKSGMYWDNFNEVLSENYLPHQVKFPTGDPRLLEPNNSLLFIANIGMYPNKPFQGHVNFQRLFIHQLLQAVQRQTHLQSYGLVRMLIWVIDKEKYVVLPHTLTTRRALSVDAEIICDKFQQIAGAETTKGLLSRESKVEMESSTAVLKRMEANNIETPINRRTRLEIEARSYTGDDAHPPKKREMYFELAELRKQYEAGEFEKYVVPPTRGVPAIFTAKYFRMKDLGWREVKLKKAGTKMDHLMAEDEALREAKEKVLAMPPDEAKEAQVLLDKQIRDFTLLRETYSFNDHATFINNRENRKALRLNPPMLHWDRREFEPLKVRPEDFYPGNELTLLDMHPKATWPLFRTRQVEDFEFLLSTMFMHPAHSVKKALTSLAHGAYDWIVPECPSLTDPKKGGERDLNELSVRCLTEEMLKEIVESWIKWPFRPSRYRLLTMTGKVPHFDDDADDWHGRTL
ncbi:hypothetical protein PVAG01_03159 [Phlyctema vagabunda]|uniref:rRNA adenine N(6)-methyltransferase n=1 Tax=Phlyctema vagabunda TaxID=108571 RepID=A0ABR4PT48_9HELO